MEPKSRILKICSAVVLLTALQMLQASSSRMILWELPLLYACLRDAARPTQGTKPRWATTRDEAHLGPIGVVFLTKPHVNPPLDYHW